MFDIKHAVLDRMRRPNLVAHGRYFGRQAMRIAWGFNHRFADGVKTLAQVVVAQHESCAGHGLVLPCPRGVAAALLLVVGIGGKRGDQHPRVAVGPQCGVNLIQITLARLDGQTVDQLSHQRGVDLAGTLVLIFIDENDVQIAAITQLLATQFAVGNDGKLVVLAMTVFETAPAPLGGDPQHRVSQRAQVIGNLLNGEFLLHVARECPEDFGMVCPAQQVQQSFLIVFTGCLQRLAALFQFSLEFSRHEPLLQHAVAGQLIDDTGVLEQVPRRPSGCAQHAKQSLMHQWALQQQRQITLPSQQGFDPVSDANSGVLADFSLPQPLPRASYQPNQTGAGFLTQSQHAGMISPQCHPVPKCGWQLLQQLVHVSGCSRRFFPAIAALAFLLTTTEQRVKFLRDEFAPGIQLGQKGLGRVE